MLKDSVNSGFLALTVIGDSAIRYMSFPLQVLPRPPFSPYNNPMTDPESSNSLESLQAAFHANPHDISVLSRLAQCQASHGDYNSACDLYEKLVGLDSDNGLAWMALGHCYLLRAEYQKCFQAYQKALGTLQDRKNAQLWYGIGLMYTKLETYEHAEPAFQTVLRIEPDFEQKSEVLFKLSQVYFKLGNYASAATFATSSLQEPAMVPSRRVEAFCQAGACYEKLRDMDKALENYRKAVEMDPGSYKSWEYLGWAMARSGLDGSSELRNALKCVGENTAEEGDLHYLLGRTALERKQYVESKEEFQLAIFKNSQTALYWCSIGVLYALALQPQDAFESLVKASNLPGAGEEIWLNMGILYEHCKQKNEAILAYDRALAMKPSNVLALERKVALSSNQPTSAPPDYVQPYIEISEGPFSQTKDTKAQKSPLPLLIETEENQEVKTEFTEESANNVELAGPQEAPIKRKRPIEQRAAPKPPSRAPAPPPLPVSRPQPTPAPLPPQPFGVLPYYSPYVMPPSAPQYLPYPNYYGQVLYPQYMMQPYYPPPQAYYPVPQPLVNTETVAPPPQEQEEPSLGSEESSEEEYEAEEDSDEEDQASFKRRRVNRR